MNGARQFDGHPTEPIAADLDRRKMASGCERQVGQLSIHVERVEASTLATYTIAWADLCVRSLEPNVYLQPAFLLPLLERAGAGRRLSFLLVWEENGPAEFGRLLGLFPMQRRWSSSLDGVVGSLAHEQTSCGIPLVDRDHAPAVFDAALSWLAARCPFANALTFKGVAANGAFHEALVSFCAGSSRPLHGLDSHQRAILRRRDNGDPNVPCHPSAKRRKEYARLVRRLEDAGARIYSSARTPDEIAAATDRFLALERQGWKGKRGTALLSDPGLAAFVRAMTHRMAGDRQCRIDSLDVDGKPVAMGIILRAGDRCFFWKTAFDEAYAALSPGVQFAVELTRVQLGDPTVALTDSCAIANHPMIDKVWADRMAITDLILAVRPGCTRRFACSLRLEKVRRIARNWMKAVWHRRRPRNG